MGISIDRAADEIIRQLNLYSKLVEAEIDDVNEEVASQVIETLRNGDYKDKSGKYRKGFAVVREKRPGRIKSIVHNKKRYMLTHLLEKGHATRSGSRTKAYPHWIDAETKAIESYSQKLLLRIRQVGK